MVRAGFGLDRKSMTVLAKTASLLLIVIAAIGSPAWCWPAIHTPLQDPLDQPAKLSNTLGEGGLPLFLSSRGTPVDMTWLARRMPLTGMLAGQMPAASATDAFTYALTEVCESTRNGSATTSLITLHSQLTV
jgi:hypothetical protein